MAFQSRWNSITKSLPASVQAMPMFGQHNSYQQMQDQSTPLYAQQSPYLQQGSYAQHSPQPQYQQPASYEAHHQQLTTYDSQYGGYQTKQSASPTGSSRLRKRLERLGRYLKIMMLVSTVISLILSLVMEAAMIYMTYAFYSTKNKTASGSKGQVTPWAKETILWPTYLLLGASGVSVLGAAVILVMLCCNFRKRMAFKLVYYLLQVVLWVTVAVVYRLSKGTRDMWGWACHNEATERQQLFKEVVNFTSLCKLQGASWETSLAESGIKLLFTLAGWLVSRKMSSTKRRLVSSLGDAAADHISDLL